MSIYSVFQVPIDCAVKQVLKQLGTLAKGDYSRPRPITAKRKAGSIIFAAVNIPVTELQGLLHKVSNGLLHTINDVLPTC